jgi:signal transduction histidine kinase
MEAFVDSLDIFTLLVAMSLVYLGSFAFSLVLFFVRKTFAGAKHWLAGQGLLAFGIIGMALQSAELPYGLLSVSNVALIGSALLLGHALWRFRSQKPFPVAMYLILPMALVAWFAMESRGVAARIVVFSGLLCLLSLWDAYIILRDQTNRYRLASIVASLYFFAIALSAGLRVVTTIAGSPPITIYEEGRMSAFSYLMAILVAFFNLFGYFIMSAVRNEEELHDTGDALRERNRRLLRLVSMKDALISVLGHDLRAPISSAARYTRNQLLEYEGDLNGKRDNIATLAEGLDRAALLLENLVEWARSESGKLELKPEPLSLAKVVGEAASDVASTAEDKGILIRMPVDDAYAAADSRAALTVFRNLLSNAIKYSKPGGSIGVRIHCLPDGRAQALVEDDGVGLRPEQIDRMFLPGRTILTLGTNGEQGTGMGLALCKAFMEAMGGSIEAQASETGGARFVLEFPATDYSPPRR